MPKQNIARFIDFIATGLIGIFCFLYSIFYARFSEIHGTFSFLDFPVFVGEILMIICIILFILKLVVSNFQFKKWHLLLLVYIAFVLWKALTGYLEYGPLAFRNAALFYYFLFAFLSYYFFDVSFLRIKVVYFTVLIILTAAIPFGLPESVFLYTYLMLIAVLLLQKNNHLSIYLKKNKLDICHISILSLLIYLAITCVIFITFPHKILFSPARSVMMGNITAFGFLMLGIYFIIRIKRNYKIFLFLFIGIVFLTGFYFLADKNNLRSMLTPGFLFNKYHEYTNFLDQKKEYFQLKNIPAGLYYSDIPGKQRVAAIRKTDYKADLEEKRQKLLMAKNIEKSQIALSEPELLTDEEVNEIYREVYDSPKPKSRPMGIAYGNVIWRLLVWRDMMRELFVEGNLITGIDFGRPFRSISIEILGTNQGEINKMGWVEPHNSFVHIIYRSGILGLVFIISVVFIFIRTAFVFIKRSDVIGIFLASAVLFWFVFSSFVVSLELPHFAIPFWALFGVVLRYGKYPPLRTEKKIG